MRLRIQPKGLQREARLRQIQVAAPVRIAPVEDVVGRLTVASLFEVSVSWSVGQGVLFDARCLHRPRPIALPDVIPRAVELFVREFARDRPWTRTHDAI